MLLYRLRVGVLSLCDMIQISMGGQDLPQGIYPSGGSEEAGYSQTDRKDCAEGLGEISPGENKTFQSQRANSQSTDSLRAVEAGACGRNYKIPRLNNC